MGRLDFETETLIPVTGGFFDGPTHSLTQRYDSSEDGCGRGTPLVPVTSSGRGWWDESDTAATLRSQDSANKADMLVPVAIRTAQTSANGHGLATDVAHTLDGANGQAVAFAQNQLGEVRASEIVNTLNTNSNASGRNTAMACIPGAIAFDSKGTDAQPNEVSPTLRSMNHDGSHANAGGQVAVALQMNFIRETRIGDYAGALQANPGDSQFNGVWELASGVRRLTPRECERLQGFPDDYTLINFRGKPAADGPRYKALGNSMAVPVMSWIGKRIALVRAYLETLTPTES